MLLQTSLKPNSDDTLPQDFGSITYAFTRNADGELECEVEDDEHVAVLLGTGDFYPADGEDFIQAADLINQDPDEEDDDEGEDETFTAPVEGEEANVPPPVGSKRAKRAKA